MDSKFQFRATLGGLAFEADSAIKEVATQICLSRANAIQFRTLKINEPPKIRIVVQRDPLGPAEVEKPGVSRECAGHARRQSRQRRVWPGDVAPLATNVSAGPNFSTAGPVVDRS